MPEHQLTRVLRLTRWMWPLLAACTSLPSNETSVPTSLRRFEEAASFLLPGHQSLAFYTLPLDDAPATPGLVVLCARCGMDFQPPRGVGYGAFLGVEVMDFGSSGLDGAKPAGEPTTIGGVPVWHLRSTDTPQPERTPDSWVAHVDGRFVVSSHDREQIELALQRSGRLEQLLIPFASLPALPPDSESVIYLLPRPTDRTYWGRPVPIELMRASLSPENRLQLWHRQPLPEPFTSWSTYAHGPPTTISDNGWLVTTMDLQIDVTLRWLLLETISGLAIFI
jgi:hypothetical protein